MKATRLLGTLGAALAVAACTTGDGQGALAVPGMPPPAVAQLTAAGFVDHLDIRSTADAFGGAVPPGAAGPYRVITGIVHGRLLRTARDNAGIVDLRYAPHDAEGYVAYSTDFVILRPTKAADAPRILFYEVVNRGNKLALSSLLGAQALGAGGAPDPVIPSLLQKGYTIVWSGWQGDIPQTGRGDAAPLGVSFPIARGGDGDALTGMTREEYVPDTHATAANAFRLAYPPASLTDRSEVTFLARRSWLDANGRQDYAVPAASVADWHYVANEDGSVGVRFVPPAALPGPDGSMEAPDAGTIYSFAYRAKDPVVNGIGFAAVRDLIHFLRHGDADRHGNANPLADLKGARCAEDACGDSTRGNFDFVIGQGTSQSGRFLRDFLYQGFNRDIEGKKVFDGMIAVIPGGRRTWTNHRFSQIGRWSRQHEDHFMPGDQFPFAYNVIRDPLTGSEDGLMRHCLASATCPHIMQIDGSFEWWGGRASLVTTDGAGHDLPLPDNVRYYMVAGTQHGGGQGAGTGSLTLPAPGSQCQLPGSPVTMMPVIRALIPAMEQWLAAKAPPPASRYPTRAAGDLVAPDRLDFPTLRDAILPSGPRAAPARLSFTFRDVHNQLYVTSYAGAAPVVDPAARYRIMVPRVDGSGNETSGVLVPDVSVPLASYTGWNIRNDGHAAGEACSSNGAAIPFARDAAARSAGMDPRPALAERYRGRADYQARVAAAAQEMVAAGYLLPPDAEHVFIAPAMRVSPYLLPE